MSWMLLHSSNAAMESEEATYEILVKTTGWKSKENEEEKIEICVFLEKSLVSTRETENWLSNQNFKYLLSSFCPHLSIQNPKNSFIIYFS